MSNSISISISIKISIFILQQDERIRGSGVALLSSFITFFSSGGYVRVLSSGVILQRHSFVSV